MVDCLISQVGEIGKCIFTQCLWPPMKRHVDYLWCFDDNIQVLKDGIRDLDRETSDINQKLEEARHRSEKPIPMVEEWSKASTDKLVEARRVLPDDNIPKAWNLISRYSMGKNAKKAAEEIAKHRNDGNFIRISDPPPPPSMGSPSYRQIMEFKSRERIEEEIMESLRSSGVSVIGICGMGGVGKTTMVQKIRKRVKDEKLFEEVVMVVVRQQNDMFKIQEEIAELFGLNFSDKTMSARAEKLRMRLMDAKRKIIIFDDVWEMFKLEDLGVPFESGFERCKILLTTRSKDLCEEMEAQNIIAMKILTDEEAWILFKEKAGRGVEDSALLSVAKDVVAECKGLPIALVTVGKALQNREKSIWLDSLSQLRRSNPIDFSKVREDVYKPLKLSYDHLESEREKLVFLLCCLFPEDYNISVEQLTWYCMGLRIFGDVTSIAEARNRTRSVVDRLKNRFLLMDAVEEYPYLRYGFYIQSDELHVKMHDVVRDVAIYIGSDEKGGFLKILEKASMDSPRANSSDVNCNWMSVDISKDRTEVPVRLNFPKLLLLMLLKWSSNEFSDISFEGMEDLNVLFFSGFPFRSTPPMLKNLRTLYLYSCAVENISVIGELTGLEILSCYRCYNIKELPAEIGKLNCLRLLELCYCQRLRTIPFGVISSLILLEELKIVDCFWQWEAKESGKEWRNASLTELESLPNLSCLQIEIDDWNLAVQDIRLSQNLVKFCILISPENDWFEEKDYEKVINLNMPSDIGALGNWIRQLVRKAESLTLEGDGSNNFNIAECENLRNLKFRECSRVKKLVETKDCKSGIVFPMLESLKLIGLKNLEEICDGTIILNQNSSLCNLKRIFIEGCSNLSYLFPVSVARRCLLQLEFLRIEDCDAMEQVFRNEITDDAEACIEFPKLKELRLSRLPNLTSFCQGLENIKFPNLTDLAIENLPKLNSESSHDDATSFHFLCNIQKVEVCSLRKLILCKLGDNIRNIWCYQIPINFFYNLRQLVIVGMNGIRSLMPYSIAKNLVSLEYMHINNCEEMVEVIEDNEKDKLVDIKCLFPNLKVLHIWNLHKLRRFWQWNYSLELPLVELVIISDCPVMETFTLGSLNTPNIRSIDINGDSIDDEKDLNHAIHQHWTLSLKKDEDEKEKENKDVDLVGDGEEEEKENKDKDKDKGKDKDGDEGENEKENKDKDVDRVGDEKEKENKDVDLVGDGEEEEEDEKENEDEDEDEDWMKPYIISGLRVRRCKRTTPR